MSQQKRLVNKSKGDAVIARDVRKADSFATRALGLIGRSGLPDGETLLIQGTKLAACNSVHTCFMRFPIDVVFVDDTLTVRSIVRNLKPWRVTWPAFGATSAFEFSAGALAQAPIAVGDVLHVGD